MAHVELTIKNKEALGIKQEKQGNNLDFTKKSIGTCGIDQENNVIYSWLMIAIRFLVGWTFVG